eukprot:13998910-Alexandrium_andersonii.AAC.1
MTSAPSSQKSWPNAVQSGRQLWVRTRVTRPWKFILKCCANGNVARSALPSASRTCNRGSSATDRATTNVWQPAHTSFEHNVRLATTSVLSLPPKSLVARMAC